MGIVDILSAPPESVIYHLVMLFALQAIFGMALDEWQRSRQVEFRRLTLAVGTLLGLRVLLMFAALIGSLQWLPSQGVIPPLERFIDLASSTLVLYAFLPRDDKLAQLTRSACLINLALALVVYGAFAPLWFSAVNQSPLIHYNGHWQEIVWEVWQFLVLGWAIVMLRRGTVVQRGLVLTAFFALLAGHILHLALGEESLHIAGWERVAGIIAWALLVAGTYRAVIGGLVARSLDAGRDSWTAVGQVRETEKLYKEVERVLASVDLPGVLQRATESVLNIFEANLCAILLFDRKTKEVVSVAAVRRADGTYEIDKGMIWLKSLPVIGQVLLSQKQATLEARGDDLPSRQRLLTALNSQADEALTLTPLLFGPESIGVLVVGDAPTDWLVPQVQGTARILSALIGAAVARALSIQPGTQ